MKEFPYTQNIIWEKDVEQIEWVEEFMHWNSSCTYLVKLTDNDFNLVRFRNYGDVEGIKAISQSGWDIEMNEILCWAKL